MAWNLPSKDRKQIREEFKKLKEKVPFFKLVLEVKDKGEEKGLVLDEGIGAALWITCRHNDKVMPNNLIVFGKGLKTFTWSLRKILDHKSLEACSATFESEFSYTVNSRK